MCSIDEWSSSTTNQWSISYPNFFSMDGK